MFKIIGTGSSGNCFKFKNIMIDAGLPYSKIKDYLNGVTHVFISHKHSDHLNMTTLRKILALNENISIVCGEFLKNEILKIADENQIIIIYPNNIYKLGGLKISPIVATHDVECYGLRIMDENGHKHFHITDTSTLDGIEAKNYDTVSIECNHEINKALEMIKEAKENGEFTHLKGAINSHLSVDKAIQFCKENHIKKLYPVHIGSSTKKEVIDALREF